MITLLLYTDVAKKKNRQHQSEFALNYIRFHETLCRAEKVHLYMLKIQFTQERKPADNGQLYNLYAAVYRMLLKKRDSINTNSL